MLLNHVRRLPGLRRMAACTVRAQFGLMHIGMAGRAGLFIPRELQLLMTRSALHRLVLTRQQEPGCRMIETRVALHRPRIRAVT